MPRSIRRSTRSSRKSARRSTRRSARKSARRSTSRSARRSGRKSSRRGKKPLSPWIKHVMAFHAAHPGQSYKQSMKQAKHTYRSGAVAPLKDKKS